MKNTKHQQTKPKKLTGEERNGLVIALFGANAEIQDDNGTVYRSHLRKNAEPIITGDRVIWQLEKDDTGVIIEHLPRKSLLYRPENAKKIKLIAANIDVVIVVTAPPPILSEHMIDRYLTAAANVGIQPVILLNKSDLLNDRDKSQIENNLAIYEKIGFPVIFSSTYTRDGLTELNAFLNNRTAVLVGASGVGKSSIIAALTSETSIKIGEVSASTGLGKHTTTLTRLYHLANGGKLIDSPGVREFGLWHIEKNQVMAGFPELNALTENCKFRDCQHQKEPGCALIQAVAEEQVSKQRFDSYQKIMIEVASRKKSY